MFLRIGTRGSKLALIQTKIVSEKLIALGCDIEVVVITTTGDRLHSENIFKLGGKEVFVKEIQNAILSREIDIAVHSMKDIPANDDVNARSAPASVCDHLAICAVLERYNPHDALISNENYQSIFDIPAGCNVGSSSPRRAGFIAYHRPDLVVTQIRGNIDTRYQKLSNGEYDAIILAGAALDRMRAYEGFLINYSVIPADIMLPAACQGAIAIEARADNAAVIEMMRKINHHRTFVETYSEREITRHFNGNCSVAFAVNSRFDERTGIIESTAIAPTKAALHKVTESYDIVDVGDMAGLIAAKLREHI